MVRAGAGKVAIDLDGILPFDGFDEVCEQIHARALVVEADVRACIVSLEVTSLRPDLVRELRTVACEEARCDVVATWVCATHSFSSPHVRTPGHLASSGQVERNARLRAAYVSAVRAAVREAAASMVEVMASRATGSTSVNVDRDVRTPGGWWLGADSGGYSDHGLRAVSFDRADATPVAVLLSADVQSSVLDHSHTPEGLRMVSPDLAGAAAAAIERARGGVALFLLGTAADQAPVWQAVSYEVSSAGEVSERDSCAEGPGMVERLGGRLALDAMAALEHAVPLDMGHIVTESHELVCPGQVRAEFASLAPTKTYSFRPSDPVRTTVSALALGSYVLVGVEPELESRTGSAIRSSSRGHGDVFTMVNGGAKYLPRDESYDRITYEAMNSGFARGADRIITDDVRATIDRLARNGRTA